MISNEKVAELISQRKFQIIQTEMINRLTRSRLDANAWSFLGQAMLGLDQGKMAELCFHRVALLDPYAMWVDSAIQQTSMINQGQTDQTILGLLEVPKRTVTALILTRNNECTIDQCLYAVEKAVDEIVVVDTGSSDITKMIVKHHGIIPYEFKWCDDFSAARNFSLSLASTDWVMNFETVCRTPGGTRLATGTIVGNSSFPNLA